jgi:hypothetical protein
MRGTPCLFLIGHNQNGNFLTPYELFWLVKLLPVRYDLATSGLSSLVRHTMAAPVCISCPCQNDMDGSLKNRRLAKSVGDH